MATPASPTSTTVVPAQLGFLAIYNPTLGSTDETLDNQIVYYASLTTQSQKRRHRSRGKPTDHLSQNERNERLRQIGLAQGMVDFSRGFSGGEPLDTIDTEQSRVILRELEPGWWVLASIDLTKLPLPPRLGVSADKNPDIEYSSREVKPATLLLQDLLRAHSTFLLHHASSLSALFVRSKRSKFVTILGRYWDLFLSTWNVMLHGNPACNVFGGIKIAASGELGVGVGEEERGSGEREVLEGFIGRTEGLTDLVVSKFGPADLDGEGDSERARQPGDGPRSQWLGTGEEPGAEDGAIFLGVGALSRKSLRDVTFWMEDIYTWGEEAYGVRESPTSVRLARKRRPITSSPKAIREPGSKVSGGFDGTKSAVAEAAPSATEPPRPNDPQSSATEADRPSNEPDGETGMNKFMGYLKMGYGTHWSLGGSSMPESKDADVKPTENDSSRVDVSHVSTPKTSDNVGHFLIGLKGDVEEPTGSDPETPNDEAEDVEYNSRVLLRTLTVELADQEPEEADVTHDLGSQDHELLTTKSGSKDSQEPSSYFDSQDRNKSKKMRVVVYVSKPFMYTFLFENRTDSLAWDGMYRSLHYQLAPLRKLLATSTAYRPNKPDMGPINSHIFDLVWDPKALTIHSTIPNIPDPQRYAAEEANPNNRVWTRVEAMNTHLQILNMYTATLNDFSEMERTSKTSRGWWIAWTRIIKKVPLIESPGAVTSPGPIASPQINGNNYPVDLPPTNSSSNPANTGSGDSHVPSTTACLPVRPRISNEIFLIRRAGEMRGIRASLASAADADGGSGNWSSLVDRGEGSNSRLAQGIGIDTRKYIDGLLSINR